MKFDFSIPANAFIYPKLGYKPRALEIALASLAINILGLAMSLVAMQVYDRILAHHGIGTLNLLCLGAVIAVIAEALLKLARAYSVGWGAATFEHTVACNAVRHTLAQETNKTNELSIGEYLQRVGAIAKLRDFYSGQSLATLIDLPFIAVFLALIAHVGGSLVLTPLALLALMILRAGSLGKRLKTALHARNKADDARYDFMIHTLTGIHSVKALGREAAFERRYERWQGDCTRSNYDVASLSASAYDQGVIASHIMMIAVGVTGAPLVLSGQMTLGALVACVMLSGRIMQPVQKALGFWTKLQDIELAHRKISDHFKGEALENNHDPEVEREGRLELKHVSFSYPHQEKLLDDISISLAPGETIAISGDHGAGKQTLLKLIAGVMPPVSGDVLVDGMSPHLYTSETLVDHIGYLPPSGVIFRGTIAENLSRFGRISEDRVHEIAALLGIHEEIASLPAGMETKLEGSHSDAIPPGLRQRIAIARVLATKPRVLLFYNADRALDREGYGHLYRLLGRLKGRVTLILVSNDQNILRLAEKHYVLDEGKLIEHAGHGAASYETHAYREMRL